MITFDILTLKAFIKEQADFLSGARLNKIQQPTRREFIFTLRNNGESKQLYVNIDPRLYHVCFISDSDYKKRALVIPKKPPMFCMLLRKYIENAKIIKVYQPEHERILEFHIETSDSIGQKVILVLAVEFMGKHSNIVLYNKESRSIIGCAHNVGSDKSRERELYGGIPYVYPPKQNKSDILDFKGNDINYDKLESEFYMFSKAFAKLCRGLPLEKLKSFVRLENLSPSISKDYSIYSLFGELLSNDAVGFETVNEMINNYYTYYISDAKLGALRTKYRNIVSKKLTKLTNSVSEMNNRLKSYSEGDKYRLYGDLLMANLYNLSDYSDRAEVFDYESNKNIVIPVDKSKTVKENASRFYKRYNKSKSAKLKLSELTEKSLRQKEYCEHLLYYIDSAQTMEDLYEISSEVVPDSDIKPEKPVSEVSFNELKDGTRIYIGKNNKQNDYIISKIASEDDLWFHVKDNPGSHVLLKTQNLTDDLILTCAKLAKENSRVKDSSKIGVIYTRRKYLRKPPGADLGYVTYKNEKEIILD